MKKTLLILAALLALTHVSAQEIGIRFGSGLENNVAIDGIFSIGEYSRVHTDVAFSNAGLGVAALWNFSFEPINDFPDLHWYLGAGPFAVIGDDFDLGVAGEIGIEYQFLDIPLIIGLDWRPTLEVIDHTRFSISGVGLNVRYQFNR